MEGEEMPMLTRSQIVAVTQATAKRTLANETGVSPVQQKHAERLAELQQEAARDGTDPAGRLQRLIDFVAASIDAARAVETPFFHLVLDRVFPDHAHAA